MEWLRGITVYFLSYDAATPNDLIIQSLLTIFAALLGALAAHWFHELSESKRRTETLRSRAISAVRKISRAYNFLYGIKNAFYGQIPEGMQPNDYWKVVLPSAKVTVQIDQLADEEYELLMKADNSGHLAADAMLFLDRARAEIDALTFYSQLRRDLAVQLDPFIREFDAAGEEISYGYVPNEHRGLHRNVLEVSALCAQNLGGLSDTLERAGAVSALINEKVPKLFKKGAFEFSIELVANNPNQALGDAAAGD